MSIVCDKKLFEDEGYAIKVKSAINKLENNINDVEAKVEFFKKHTLQEIIDMKTGFSFVYNQTWNEQEQEYNKGLMLLGWKSGLARKKKQKNKLNLYLNFLDKNIKKIDKIYFTHKTIAYIFEVFIETKTFSKTYVNDNLLPDYKRDIKSKEFNIKHYLASVEYIKFNIGDKDKID